MVALDRPNREQVVTGRLSAATTLQSLELTNGSTLDAKLQHTGRFFADDAARDTRAWLDRLYLTLIARPPSDAERTETLAYLGEKPNAERVSDVLWALVMLPEFQLIN